MMQSALRIEAKVLPGNKIEIDLPPDTALNTVGKTIEVILLLPEKPTQSTEQSILEILAEIHAQRPSSRNLEEINRDLQAERDAWDS
ncbi:hypothetical protein [Coleofasciculus sp. E1-EBD-02]|uniref:hypothetical protein n=1 Tax=Coleofasciculus sp. E1-EBD-02 TaxID=3068481 RepID=UPI0032F93382